MNKAVLLTALLLAGAHHAEAKARFSKVEMAVPGQIFGIDGDLDGDGLVDLVVGYGRGIGPEAQRYLAVFFRGLAGFAREPDLKFGAPPSTAIRN